MSQSGCLVGGEVARYLNPKLLLGQLFRRRDTMKRMIRAYGCAFIVLAVGSLAFAQPQYSVLDLEATYGSFSTVTDINDHGVIVGKLSDGGFLIDSTGFHIVPRLPDGRAFFPLRINNNGHMLGFGHPGGAGSAHSFILANGVFTDLNVTGNLDVPAASDLNDSDVVVGQDYAAHRAFRWSSGQLSYLPYTGVRSDARAVNSTGDAAGSGLASTQVFSNAVRWTSQGFTNLAPPSQFQSNARDINDGQVCVGWLENSIFVRQAVMWNAAGQTILLGDFGGGMGAGGAYEINSSGRVVGSATDAGGLGFGFFWENGQMYKVQDLLPPGNGWYIEVALNLNDSGQIICLGTRSGHNATLLLTPVPEESTIVVVVSALLAIVSKARRREGDLSTTCAEVLIEKVTESWRRRTRGLGERRPSFCHFR